MQQAPQTIDFNSIGCDDSDRPLDERERQRSCIRLNVVDLLLRGCAPLYESVKTVKEVGDCVLGRAERDFARVLLALVQSVHVNKPRLVQIVGFAEQVEENAVDHKDEFVVRILVEFRLDGDLACAVCDSRHAFIVRHVSVAVEQVDAHALDKVGHIRRIGVGRLVFVPADCVDVVGRGLCGGIPKRLVVAVVVLCELQRERIRHHRAKVKTLQQCFDLRDGTQEFDEASARIELCDEDVVSAFNDFEADVVVAAHSVESKVEQNLVALVGIAVVDCKVGCRKHLLSRERDG